MNEYTIAKIPRRAEDDEKEEDDDDEEEEDWRLFVWLCL